MASSLRHPASTALAALFFAGACSSSQAEPSSTTSPGASTTTSSSGAGGAATGSGGARTGGTGTGGAAPDAGAGGAPAAVVPLMDAVRIGSDPNKPNFQAASTTLDFGSGPFQKVVLVVDLASTCYPFSSWKNDPPPQGQNWPADCDAFDRNWSFFLDEPAGQGSPPALELVHAITPFGGPEHLEVDVTDVANGLPGKHQLTTRISTWSDGAGKVSGSNGGWNVSAHLEVTAGPAPRKVLAVVPLLATSLGKGTPSALGAPIAFEVPAGAVDGRIEARTSGHGGGLSNGAPFPGCIGPAEEFCKRKHVVQVDGADLADVWPWRTDCTKLCTLAKSGNLTYCQENPCGDVNSVKAPRANWCPGSMTPPYEWKADALKTPGKHELTWSINDVADGGSWQLSAIYFAYGG
jgi:hypothetical protein